MCRFTNSAYPYCRIIESFRKDIKMSIHAEYKHKSTIRHKQHTVIRSIRKKNSLCIWMSRINVPSDFGLRITRKNCQATSVKEENNLNAFQSLAPHRSSLMLTQRETSSLKGRIADLRCHAPLLHQFKSIGLCLVHRQERRRHILLNHNLQFRW